MEKLHIRKGSLALVVVGIVVSMFVVDGIKRYTLRPSTKNSITVEENSSFPLVPHTGNSDTNIIGFEEHQAPHSGMGKNSAGFNGARFSAEELNYGYLAVYGQLQPVTVDPKQRKVVLENYRNDFYSVLDDSAELDSDAADALNRMMSDYHKATGLDDFVVYGTTATYADVGSKCPRSFAESASGYTIDLALLGVGGYIAYDGYDEEGWVNQHCTEYGFIVRYPEEKYEITGQKYCPWHLRYVGKVHADAMAQNGMCLEEYTAFLKGFTKDEPFRTKLGGTSYEIYAIPSAGEMTEAEVPYSGKYELSGDNNDTFFVTVRK